MTAHDDVNPAMEPDWFEVQQKMRELGEEVSGALPAPRLESYKSLVNADEYRVALENLASNIYDLDLELSPRGWRVLRAICERLKVPMPPNGPADT